MKYTKLIQVTSILILRMKIKTSLSKKTSKIMNGTLVNAHSSTGHFTGNKSLKFCKPIQFSIKITKLKFNIKNKSIKT